MAVRRYEIYLLFFNTNEWTIFQDKFRISKRPYNFLFITQNIHYT